MFGHEIGKPEVGERLVHLKKQNKVAIMVSNESLTALDWFLIEAGFPFGGNLKYNDVVRNVYDALFELTSNAISCRPMLRPNVSPSMR